MRGDSSTPVRYTACALYWRGGFTLLPTLDALWQPCEDGSAPTGGGKRAHHGKRARDGKRGNANAQPAKA
jgi:hypothetical protein